MCHSDERKSEPQQSVLVAQFDIQQGERGSARHGPISRALHRKTGSEWSVTPNSIQRLDDGASWETPSAVYWWIIDFDKGRKVEPFRFRLEPD